VANENLELIKGLFAGVEGGDPEALRQALPALIEQLCTEDIEFVETPERVDARTHHGHEGVMQAFSNWLDQWARYDFEAKSFEEHGDQVFVVMREEGRGHSGATAGADLYLIYDFRDGKISRYREFYDEKAARAALDG
jgi:ketosteroid isomerase-like protein